MSSCSIVAEYPVYVARGTDPSVATQEYAQPPVFLGTKAFGPSDVAVQYGSLVYSTDDVCVIVYETEITVYRTLFIGPAGCPCFPLLFFNDLPERPDLFHLALLFVTRHKEHGFSFDPRRVSIQQVNGSVTIPDYIKGGRAHTKWEKVCPVIAIFHPCRLVEQAADIEELTIDSTSVLEGGYELWDWTAFKMTFRNSQESQFPIHVNLEGISNSGQAYKLAGVDLVPGKGRVGYVYPVDPKKAMGRASPQTCRSLWNDKPDIS